MLDAYYVDVERRVEANNVTCEKDDIGMYTCYTWGFGLDEHVFDHIAEFDFDADKEDFGTINRVSPASPDECGVRVNGNHLECVIGENSYGERMFGCETTDLQ